ncbi:MAG: PAS domain S-box protein [Proteobacteria bacterium]|nr:PAS domain S-box protein [Pseudomonadota bacterium]
MPQLRRLSPLPLGISIALSMVLSFALCAAVASAAISSSVEATVPETRAPRAVRVGVYDFAPMVFSENGQAKGFFVDMLADLAEAEQWRLVFIPGTWAECLSRLESGEIDLLPSIAQTPERDELFRFTEEFLFLDWGVIYKKRGSAIRTVFDLEGKTITALRGSVYTEKLKALLEQFGIKADIVTKPDYAEALAAVGRGEADAGVCTNVLGTILDRNLAITRTDIVFAPIKLRMAVKRGGREDLLPTLDRHLGELKAQPGSLYYQLHDKWLGLAARSSSPRWLPWTLGGGLLVLCVLAAFVVSLRLLVQRRTDDLRKSEKRYLTTLTAVNDGLWDWHVPTGEAYFSPLYYGVLGYADQEFPASYDTWRPLVHPEDIDSAEHELKRCIETGQSFSIDLRMRTRDGGWKWVCTRGKAIERDAGGRALRMVGTLSDVTHRKGLEASLRESELHFRTLANLGQALIWTSTPDKLCNYFNEPWLAFTGRSLEQELGNGWTEGVHPDDFQRCLDIYVAAFDKRESFSMEYRLRHHSGEYRWIVDKGSPRYDSQGDFLGYIGHCLDISETKQAEEALRRYQEFTRIVMENLPIGLAVNSVDPSVAFEYMNDNFPSLYRTTKEQLALPDGFWEAVYEDPEQREQMRARVLADCASGDPERMFWTDIPITRKGEPTTYVAAHNVPLPEHGLMISTVWDVTQRKQTEEALRQTEMRFRLLFENAPLPYQSLNERGYFLDVNRRWLETLGYEREEVIGKWFGDFLGPGFSEHFDKNFPMFKQCCLIDGVEFDMMAKDGRTIRATFNGRVQLGHDGKFLRTHCIFTDITERKRAEEALRQSEARFRLAIEEAPFPIMIHADGGEVLNISRAWTENSGYTLADIPTIGEWTRKAYGTRMEEIKGYIDSLYASQERKDEGEYAVTGSDGATRIWYFYSVPLGRLPDGRRTVLSMAFDVTSRKKMEQDILHAKDAAEAANRAKGEFLANMSHELRTPMNGVLGMLQLLMLEEELKPCQQTYATNAFEAANRLLSLLNDILDFSRIEAGVLVFKQEPFQPGDILDATVGVFSHACARKGLALRIVPEPGLPEWLLGDEARIRQLVFNLVGNAVKFTRKGGITVEAWHRTLAGAAMDRLILAVSDTGVGIPEAKLDVVFDRFSQADGSYARQFEGAGLGLAIVRRIVECLGGSLCIESEVGEGTTVVLSLPVPVDRGAAVAPQVEAGSANTEEEVPLRILLAEDELIGQLGARLMLERMGHSVVAVNDGIDAVAAALKQEFDCVLMDIQMPEMDGLEATRILRSTTLPGNGGRLPIIAMTAYALSGDREKFLAAGLDEYIAKPFRQDELRALLQTVAQRRRQGDL